MATRTEFSWQDPFFLDQQLTSEERMIRDAARDYCQDGLARRVQKANREEIFDREIMTKWVSLVCLAQQYLKNLVALELIIHLMA